ncbi:MAG: protein kinase [Elusimicrobiota bacterium]
MNYKDKWHILSEIGSGSQGRVLHVIDKNRFTFDKKAFEKVKKEIQSDKIDLSFSAFYDAVTDIVRSETPLNQGTLKIFHRPESARFVRETDELIEKEMPLFASVGHQAFIRILDYDIDEQWFVFKYYRDGTYKKNSKFMAGSIKSSILAVRPVVEALSIIHKKGLVHRNIKPGNIFIDNSNLILGDPTIVFFKDLEHSCLTATLEDINMNEWLPPWAKGTEIARLEPSIDVFSVGKLLWSMITGKSRMHGYYYINSENDLRKLLPDDPAGDAVNSLLVKCIREKNDMFIKNGIQLMEAIDEVLYRIDRLTGGGPHIASLCVVCGEGRYEMVIDRNAIRTENFGLHPSKTHVFRVLQCNNCSNVQLFSFEDGKSVPAWPEDAG